MGPGGRLQRGVPSLRTSEFWRPDLGDLEAKNLDSLEDYSLVAKNRALNSLVAPQGGRRIKNIRILSLGTARRKRKNNINPKRTQKNPKDISLCSACYWLLLQKHDF